MNESLKEGIKDLIEVSKTMVDMFTVLYNTGQLNVELGSAFGGSFTILRDQTNRVQQLLDEELNNGY
jgi:hypothetical protein